MKFDWFVSLPLPYVPSEIIDVRSPAEYEADHMPDAINLPVLSDAERIEVGTMYRAVGAFEARRYGAALVTKNVSNLLLTHFADKPKNYQPLLYCWRGGQRSNSLAVVLWSVGWRVQVLEGGYKTYRRHIIDQISNYSPKLRFQVLQGLTGSGKTRLLEHLAQSGEQVLDLEALAAHRSSLLGRHIDQAQPGQCKFESSIANALQRFHASRPVYVEAESRKVGNLQIPDPLWFAMTQSPVCEMTLPTAERIRHLLADYRHYLEAPPWRAHLRSRLEVLRARLGNELLDSWQDMINREMWEPLVRSLLATHYDPLYSSSGKFHKPIQRLDLLDLGEAELDRAVEALRLFPNAMTTIKSGSIG
jgi:tRNA 2-selenouridine synthase